jgi:hypothetical protein
MGDVGTWKEVPAPVPLRRISAGKADKVVALGEAGQLYSYRDPDG